MAKSWRNRDVIDIVTQIAWIILNESLNREKNFFFRFFFFEFSNEDLRSLSVELTHDMGIIRKLSAWSREKKSQKLEKSTF